jgi:hypothetical protein
MWHEFVPSQFSDVSHIWWGLAYVTKSERTQILAAPGTWIR